MPEPHELRVPDPARLASVQALCELAHPYQAPQGYEKLFIDAMREITRWHEASSPLYARIARMRGFDAARDLRQLEDCARVPYILASFFKAHEVRSIPREEAHVHLTSSGTTGQKSQVFFDRWSLGSGQRMVDFIFQHNGWDTPEQPCNYLLYTYETAGEQKLGTAYTDYFLCKYAPARNVFLALRLTGAGGHEFDCFGAIETLKRYENEGLPVRIFGFPAFLYFTLKRMRDLGLPRFRLHPESLIFLGGGWKGHADQAISKRELYSQVTDQLGIPDERCRDGFGSVEHAIPYVECRNHNFHAPVWSQVYVRDIRTLEVLGFGKPGLLHFVTPYITSVPGQSVLMGDLAELREGRECGCGIERPWFTVLGRAGTTKNRSCAIAAAELLRSQS